MTKHKPDPWTYNEGNSRLIASAQELLRLCKKFLVSEECKCPVNYRLVEEIKQVVYKAEVDQ